MRISDWSSDVCSSDLRVVEAGCRAGILQRGFRLVPGRVAAGALGRTVGEFHLDISKTHICINSLQQVAEFLALRDDLVLGAEDMRVILGEVAHPHDAVQRAARSEEHTSELQSLMRISYAVFCLKKKNTLCHTIITTIKSIAYIF